MPDRSPAGVQDGKALTHGCATDFPRLSAGPTPQINLEEWTFALQLNGWVLGEWKWAEFQGLPQTTIKTDIHCVTKWSKLDTIWQGVSFDDLLKAVDLD